MSTFLQIVSEVPCIVQDMEKYCSANEVQTHKAIPAAV